jgi:hypothetical protein
MSHLRVAPLLIFALLAAGQTVRSTRSGLLYFFDGSVFLEDQPVQQKFGRFPEIGAGGVLRTERGRAEVLLTPGVFLRIDESTAIRMASDSLSDTRVELLRGSVILEVNHEAVNPPDTLIYKNWQVRVAQDSIARIDADAEQVRVYSGTAEVSTDASPASVTVLRGQVLPLAAVLLPDPATTPAADAFNVWSMNRSSVVSEDNSIGAGITDDPDQIDASGAALGSFSYFPQTGIPSLDISYPYGLSFWSPYPGWVNPYLSAYPAGLLYPLYRRFPTGTLLFPHPVGISTGTGLLGRPIGVTYPRPVYAPPPRIPAIATPHVAAPHGIRR